jgi:hypothetical protein
VKIKAVSVLTSLLLVLFMTLAGATAFAGERVVPNGRLTSQIDYHFVGHFGILDEEGRLLVWEGTIEGDFTGECKWWFVSPSPVDGSTFTGGEVRFYAARWEIWDAGELLLAGDSAGKTVFPVGEDGMWDGHGVVTEAKGAFNPLKGRKVYETGPVIVGLDPPVSFFGTGMFLIY